MAVANPNPSHPGRILLSCFIEEDGMPVLELAAVSGLDPDLIQAMIDGERNVTPEIEAGLMKAWPDIGKGFWMRLQASWDAVHPS